MGRAPWSEVLAGLHGAGPDLPLLDLLRVLERIVESECEIKKSDESTDLFYTSLSIVTTHYVAVNHALLSPEVSNVVRDACRITVQHIFRKITNESALKKATEDNITVSENAFSPTFSLLQLLSPIAELYDADVANSSHSNYNSVLGHLRNALPPNSSTEKNSQSLSSQTDKIATTRRTDNLGDLLTNPLQGYPSAMSLLIASQNLSSTVTESTATETHTEAVTVEAGTTTSTPAVKQPSFDGKKWLSELCVTLLDSLRAGGILLDLCGSLPCLQRYLTRVRAARESTLTACQYHHYTGDLSLVHTLSLEVNICQTVLSLPCYEPLTASRITLLSDISAAWLLCATIQVSAHQKDEEENIAGTIVEGALCLFNTIGETLMNSTWAGGYVFKNHLMIGTWILLGGLHQVLMGGGSLQGGVQSSIAAKSPARTSGKTYNICRIIQGMNVMWVALGARFLECTRTLLADARLESQISHDNTQSNDPTDVASLDPLYNNTAAQRIGRLTICAPLHQMLVVLGAACYRKATGLKRAVVQKQHEQDADRSDSTVYYQDMIMCSEDSETDDEDSEPLLGLWFESTLVAPDVMDSCNTGNMSGNDAQDGGRGTGLVPDKAEPYSYITLGTEVFSLLESEVLSCGSHLSIAVYQLQESSIVLLSVVVKDLDRETGRTDTGTISPCFGTRLGKVYADFSAVLTRYLHLLSSSSQFVDQRQILLEQLDVAPPLPGEINGLVPLQVGCRALKLLGAVILSKPITERELTILALWNKTIYTIVECAIQAQPPQEYEYEDVNVEHSQLLIYLFHSLNLMQKKSVLLMTANAIIKVSNALNIADHRQVLHIGSHQLIFITRLLLLLEYMMKHLYDPPAFLLQQIKWNLVLSPGVGSNEPQGALVTRQYYSVPHIEQAYRRRMTQDIDYFMRPKFYALINTDINNQETPKLDGLACNFILGTPDKLKYPLLLDGLLNLLGCIGICDRRPTSPLSSLCAAHYCFQTVWRFLITLPPSTPHMEQVALGSTVKEGQACVETVPLNSLIWAPRANNPKIFGPWLKDALVKQGMYTQYAENLLSSVSNACDNISFTVWLAIKTIQQLRDNISAGGMPCLLDIINVDCVIMRLRVSLCDETQVTALATTNMDTQLTNQFMPHLLDLLETLFIHCRDCVVKESTPTGLAGSDETGSTAETASDIAIEAVFQCCGTRGAPWLRAQLPQAARSALDKANSAPSCTKPPTAFLNDAIPSESAILQLVLLHCQLISGNGGPAPALRLLASGAVELLGARVSSLLEPGCETDRDRAISLLLPAVVDGRLQFLQETASGALSKLLPTPQKVEQMLHEEVLKSTYTVMVANLTLANEKILRGMVKCWEKILERPSGRSAFEELFASKLQEEKKSLGEVLMNVPNGQPAYCSRMIRLFNKLFGGCESSENPPSPLCISICQHIGSSSGAVLTSWLRHICLGSVASAHTASTPSDSDAATPTVPPVVTPATNTTIAIPAVPKQESGYEGSNNSSPAPRNGQSDTAQQSESYSWCAGGSDSKESVAIPLLSENAENTENAILLSNLTKHIIMHCDESACMTLLMALVPLVSESLNSSHGGLPLPRLLRETTQLADSHTGDGHKILFPTAMQWLKTCVDTLSSSDMLERIEEGGGHRSLLEAACHLLAYLTDALHAGSGEEAVPAGGLPPLSWDTPADISLDVEWPDDQQDEEDTSADDSDEDSMLHLKLCTFMTTAREFMNQHWYHCHTCKMVEGIGVCTVCALVCHRNHDVSYAKYGNFFCDCGAKEESTCQALVKRSSSQSHMLNKRGASEGDQAPPPSLRRRPSSPLRTVSPPPTRQPAYATNLSGVRDWIFGFEGWTECLQALQTLLETLPGPVRLACERHAPVGRHGRGRRALAQLHHGDKRFHTTDQLMVPTLGSQEGAFENVRMSYTGEQGQTIRQLISAHMVRRVAMCCLALPHGRRQHLVVSHEKGKITIYQLSALLKQADSSKRKLTLTRLTSIPIPFTVLSLSGNPWNEDLLAVCGLRECHVITFTITGSTYERLVLQPALDTGNFIIRSIWLPGTQTQLALVTADFIKIYDLSIDVTHPQYYFLVPSGKVRDVTFICQENDTYMLCMGSGGHIYWQLMNDESHASNGPFYVTNTLEVFHNDIKDVTGQVGGGGVSIYYSHTLKILFFSYAHGKSFLAPLISVEETLRGVSLITVGSGSGSQKEGGGRSKGAQSLCQWQEVPAHPGLVTAVLQASNNPVVLMLKPGSIAVQEIKVVPVKAKITDMVTVRHASGQQELKTTLILLCEDGSLRIYAASPDQTGYWLSPTVAPPFVSPYMERTRRPKHIVRNKTPQSATKPSGAPVFPIDFFENCVALDDVEFGGNDLLQVYNTAQIKHRLNTNGLFVVSTKLSGFTLEITNPDASTVITGIRVLLGNQDIARTPSFIEVCGRTIQTLGQRNRWYDIPLSREESLQADKKLSVTFTCSQDPEGVIMVDSVKVYGRNKEVFGWPEETEDGGPCASTNKNSQETDTNPSGSWRAAGVERLACAVLEVLELALGTSGPGVGSISARIVATKILCLPSPPPLHARCKALLKAILGPQYHQHKDQAILTHIIDELIELQQTTDGRNIDPENFFRLLLLARAIAVSRPLNLVKYAGPLPVYQHTPGENMCTWMEGLLNTAETSQHLAPLLANVLWVLSCVRQPETPLALSPVDRCGLRHPAYALQALVDILHAFMMHSDQVDLGNRIYVSLLLDSDQVISFGAKSAIVRVLRPRIKRRRVYIPSPPITPGVSGGTTVPMETSRATTPPPESSDQAIDHSDSDVSHYADVDQVVDMSRLLMAEGGGLEALLDIPPDADDETMVELAIALSLQERSAGTSVSLAVDSGAPSDTTASAAASDDEEASGVVGALPAISPADLPTSESGSGADSIGGISGRSSTYGETGVRTTVDIPTGMRWAQDTTFGTETATRLSFLRLSLLNVLLDELPQLRKIRGHRSIPFMQVLLMLVTALDANVESDRLALQKFLDVIIAELHLDGTDDSTEPPESRTSHREMQLLIMRLLSVLMSRWKPTVTTIVPSTAPSTSRATTSGAVTECHAARAAAGALLKCGAVERCRILLKALLPYWREQGANANPEGTPASTHSQLLRPQPPHPLPDMQPFFLRHYVKGHAWDVMENYPHLLTEMALRLPYKIHKHCDQPPPSFNELWHPLLCEYMMNQQTPFLRKQVRKLLLMMCGTKEKYRQLRDVHALNTHMEGVHEFVESLDPSYDSNVQLMDHLKACVEIVVARTGNWQHLCSVQAPDTLSYLMVAACNLEEGVAPTVLQLLQCALCPPIAAASTASKPSTQASERTERERSADSEASTTANSKFQEQLVPQLVQQIQLKVRLEEFRHFIRTFLLETNSTAVRWQAHALMLAIYENSIPSEQVRLVNLVWGLWPALPQYGRKAAQFVDLLGYFSLKTPNINLEEHLSAAVNLLRTQNNVLLSHGNAPIYSALSNYVELDGYFLESEPCLVCNNPEVPMATIKLSTIRIDSKFTTTTQIVKLVSSHTISHIGLRISDLKRSKMVRAINVSYNNRTVQAVQELKNKPGMWHKAKHVVLQSGQTEVRIDFPLPIVACNLMMEYADFYENAQTSGESLQCPRCSAAVPANPGVCANCGENVFQCHRCRAINYDEKDPFLCHACGFCKYAKFDYTLTARPCCAVDTIENDEDRKKMVATIRTLLDKADRVYRQLVANKPLLENLLHKISEQRTEGNTRGSGEDGGSTGNTGNSSTQVNRVIQSLAHKYCVDSKNLFDELSKVIQRVLTCRRELVSYDKLQSEHLESDVQSSYAVIPQNECKTAEPSRNNCYGCALSAASHCLTLLRALASSPEHRQKLCQLGLVQELVQHNLRRGSLQSQDEVRQLICVVTRDNFPATKELCKLLTQRITLGLVGHAAAQDHTNAVRPLVLLLGGLVKVKDSIECWEVRLKCIVRLWIWCCPYLSNMLSGVLPIDDGDAAHPPLTLPPSAGRDSHALQQVALPCLQYLHHLMQSTSTATKDKPADAPNETLSSPPMSGAVLDLGAWLSGRVSYADWKRIANPKDQALSAVGIPATASIPSLPSNDDFKDNQLAYKYTSYWREKVLRIYGLKKLCLGDGGWLRPVMFNPSSKMARDTACQMVKSLCTGYERTKAIIVLLTSFLPEIGVAGEASEQFLQLYQSLATDAPWKQFLALRGVLSLLAELLTKEINHLHKLEETTLTSDLAQGYALKRLTELLAMFLEDGGIRRAYKGRLMGAVLGGYLSLRRLVVQRTRLIDDTQEKLLELLEEMTTGTEAETAEFMAVCIETVAKYPLHDFRTPVFIFERLCSIIYPEENDVREFFLTLEKDPQQEDFLQGRMLGNPYSSLEPGLGPLMRDVKNKICADCELVALLEDDTGMELLVNNKIMSLDLPVKDVYKKVWAVSGEGDAMRVVYRMRGLLGDATEEFVETLNAASVEAVDDEQLYKMANVLADCGGMEVMLERLAAAGGAGGAARPLARTLLRLLSLCARARKCVAVLTQPSTGSLPALLRALQLAASDEATRPRPELTYQLLEIMDRILSVAAGESLESFLQFSLTFGGPEYVQALLNSTECPGIRNNQEALSHLTRVLAALVYGNELKMAHLCQHFKRVLDFNKFDSERWAEDEFRLELFCVLCSGIERNTIGGTLKDYFISLGIVKDALDYITIHAPCVKPTLLRTDSDELKEFIAKPALKYILRFLTGLAADHEPTQMAVCEKVIPIVHRLEQVSSDEHVGSLAENLLEALMSEPEAARIVQEARDYTRHEKKRLAMAMREKQLGALGMRTNDKGQVTAQCSLTQQVQELGEEVGAVCCICREGYKYQPTKVLGIYTFTKRCGVEEYEVKARKTTGYTTVTHYNVVHVECHTAAVRLARTRDEWESAALQNASTKCNGLLPLWGPHVPESAFAGCLARHNTYLQESTGHRDIGYTCTIHDLKLLLLRFAREKQFHEDTGGGGPLSNMQLVPCLMHMALYVINTTRVAARELANIQTYLEWAFPRQLESAHDAEGPLYYAVLALLLQPRQIWKEERLEHLRRLLIIAQVRSLIPSGPPLRALESDQKEPRSYEDFKPYLIFFSLIQLIYDIMFKSLPASVEQWPIKLAETIRHGDETILRSSEKILAVLTEELLPCTSFSEWCDAAGLLPFIPNPDEFLASTLNR